MKNQPPIPGRPAFTAAEVVQILERAKQLGVVQLKLEGFEAAWDLPRVVAPAPSQAPEAPPVAAAAAPPPPPPRTDEPRPNVRLVNEWCPDCRSQLEIGRYNEPYCKRCYMERKDRKRQAAGRGGWR